MEGWRSGGLAVGGFLKLASQRLAGCWGLENLVGEMAGELAGGLVGGLEVVGSYRLWFVGAVKKRNAGGGKTELVNRSH